MQDYNLSAESVLQRRDETHTDMHECIRARVFL